MNNLAAESALVILVDEQDIEAMRDPIGWVTDNCIRRLVLSSSNHACLNLHFVDPNWLHEWEANGMPDAADLPSFLFQEEGRVLSGAVIPFNLGNNHWIVVHLCFVRGRATYYDSSPESECFERVWTLMWNLHERYKSFFHTNIFEDVTGSCAKQSDGSSFGLYAIRNSTDLLNGHCPSMTPFTLQDIYIGRENGSNTLRRIMEQQEDSQS